jgi:hypothetical protein
MVRASSACSCGSRIEATTSKRHCRANCGRDMFLCCANKMPAKTVMKAKWMGPTQLLNMPCHGASVPEWRRRRRLVFSRPFGTGRVCGPIPALKRSSLPTSFGGSRQILLWGPGEPASARPQRQRRGFIPAWGNAPGKGRARRMRAESPIHTPRPIYERNP